MAEENAALTVELDALDLREAPAKLRRHFGRDPAGVITLASDRPAVQARPNMGAQYIRMSTDHQRYSLEAQRAFIQSFALERGIDIVRTYVDEGRSGVTVNRRSGLQMLLRDVLSGAVPFSTILVLDVSRWGRFQDPDEAAHYEFLCREAGIRVIYCAEPFTEDSFGSVIKQLKRVMAGEYSRDLSEKVRAGRKAKAARGRAGAADPSMDSGGRSSTLMARAARSSRTASGSSGSIRKCVTSGGRRKNWRSCGGSSNSTSKRREVRRASRGS